MNAYKFGQAVREKLAAGPTMPTTPQSSWWQWAGEKILGKGTPTASQNINNYRSRLGQELQPYQNQPKAAPRLSTTSQIRR